MSFIEKQTQELRLAGVDQVLTISAGYNYITMLWKDEGKIIGRKFRLENDSVYSSKRIKAKKRDKVNFNFSIEQIDEIETTERFTDCTEMVHSYFIVHFLISNEKKTVSNYFYTHCSSDQGYGVFEGLYSLFHDVALPR